MAQFEIERVTALSTPEVWRRLTDWERHGDHIPLTTVTQSGGEGVGSTFTARTAAGPVGFDDVMEITRWDPPTQGTEGHTEGRCDIVKRGQIVAGWAELTVTPTATGTQVRWREEVAVRRTGRLLDLPIRLGSQRVFGRLVDALLRDETGQRGPAA